MDFHILRAKKLQELSQTATKTHYVIKNTNIQSLVTIGLVATSKQKIQSSENNETE